MNVHRQAPWHRNWNHRPSTHRSSSWCFWAKLMLVHISVEVVRAGGSAERIMMGGNEWRPPEAKHWSTFYSGHTVSTVTVATSSLDRIAQSQRTSASGPLRRNGSPSRVAVTFDGADDVRQSKASLAPSVTSFTRRIAPSLDTAGKHFLFRRDLSKTQDTRQTRPSTSTTFCREPTSMVGNCSANPHHREPAILTRGTSAGVTEDYVYADNRNYSSSMNGSAFLSMEGAELATLQSPLEDNHTAYYYTVVNLDNHNDVLCDDEYQLEYNENCFIDHNVTCVGDPDFCNLTYGEYRQLLMDYIYPSTGEWILIASHTVVFIMGLTEMADISHPESRIIKAFADADNKD
uniref:Uncharacterized protein n=1 Tax=Anopheles albimanus TaxID=7167 RepID=A0A182FLU9_ANOAL